MCSLNETGKLQQQTWNFKFEHPRVQKHFQQYWGEFSSSLHCQRHGVHVHSLTLLKGVYSQLCLYSSHRNQPFYTLNFYSWRAAECILPSSLLTWSVHPCYFPTSKPKNPTICIVCIGTPGLFLKLAMKLCSKGVCMVYNNPVGMWTSEFCQ